MGRWRMTTSIGDGSSDIEKKLERLQSEELMQAVKKALYKGAGSAADGIKAAVSALPTEPFRMAAPGNPRDPSPEEKALLVGAVGIAKFNETLDGADTLIGLSDAGYGTLGGKTVPIVLIARAINSGTSFRRKHPFARRGARGAKEVLKAALDDEITKLTKE